MGRREARQVEKTGNFDALRVLPRPLTAKIMSSSTLKKLTL